MGNLDGVMLGRAAYKYPHLLGEVDKEFFGEDYIVTPMAVSYTHLDVYKRQK